MEFLDISLIKGSSLFLHAIHSPFYWRILKKNQTLLWFKNPYKKSAKQENSSLLRIAFCRIEKWGNRKLAKLESEKTRVYAQKPRLNMPFKNSISGKQQKKNGRQKRQEEWSGEGEEKNKKGSKEEKEMNRRTGWEEIEAETERKH